MTIGRLSSISHFLSWLHPDLIGLYALVAAGAFFAPPAPVSMAVLQITDNRGAMAPRQALQGAWRIVDGPHPKKASMAWLTAHSLLLHASAGSLVPMCRCLPSFGIRVKAEGAFGASIYFSVADTEARHPSSCKSCFVWLACPTLCHSNNLSPVDPAH